MSTQLTQINHENVELNNQINTLKQQLDDLNNDKVRFNLDVSSNHRIFDIFQERQLNELNQELSRRREEYSNTNSKLENDLRESNENHVWKFYEFFHLFETFILETRTRTIRK